MTATQHRLPEAKSRQRGHPPRSPLPSHRTPSSSSGQAIIEFVVGIVAVLVVAALLFQVGRVARLHTEALLEAREEAGERAMSDAYRVALPGPDYIRDWRPGGDERRFSRDDEPVRGGWGTVSGSITVHGRPTDLNEQVAGNPISLLHTDPSPVDSFGLVNGRTETKEVEVMPVIRHLLYDAPSIEVDHEAWMVWTKGLQ
jgi:hypothetical protein